MRPSVSPRPLPAVSVPPRSVDVGCEQGGHGANVAIGDPLGGGDLPGAAPRRLLSLPHRHTEGAYLTMAKSARLSELLAISCSTFSYCSEHYYDSPLRL